MPAKSRSPRSKRTSGRSDATQVRKARIRKIGKTPKRKPKPASRRPKVEATTPTAEALAAFAHEVRTPLTGILAVSSLLATSDLGERERRWIDTVKAAAEHLAALTTLFVDAAKYDRSGLKLRAVFFDLPALARVLGEALAGRATAKGLQSRVEIPQDLTRFVVGDPVRLRAALENLIDNAIKFTEEGSVTLKVRERIRRDGSAIVSFAVADSGIGLSPSEAKKLFKPFSQANATIAARFGGAGLGLWSVKSLARAMGGDVTVESRTAGTLFTLTVGLKRAEGMPSSSRETTGEQAVSTRLRILSVEDNPFGRVVLDAILTELGHDTEFVGTAEAALDRLKQGTFDAVLMDMVLPGMGGVEAIRRIRALEPPHRRVGIIGVSGNANDEVAAREAGANAFLIKPVSPRALALALMETVRLAASAT